MERKWIEFETGPNRPISGLYVTLNHRGYIVFSRGVFEKMNSPEAFKLMFDPATDTIGVQPCSPLMPNAFTANAKKRLRHTDHTRKAILETPRHPHGRHVRVLHAAIEAASSSSPKTPRSRQEKTAFTVKARDANSDPTEFSSALRTTRDACNFVCHI